MSISAPARKHRAPTLVTAFAIAALNGADVDDSVGNHRGRRTHGSKWIVWRLPPPGVSSAGAEIAACIGDLAARRK